jgi:D-arabinose 1-dehydrogenase-like Zn-dependent alcohol dehydrogenase
MQKAVIVSQQGPDAAVNIVDITIPEPGIDDVLIRLSHSGVCHGDVSLIYGDWDNIGLHFQGTMVRAMLRPQFILVFN